MQHHPVRLIMISLACLLVACASPWGGDVGCLNLASYPERIDCQARNHRTISADEELRRKPSAASAVTGKTTEAADPLCYTKAGPGEKQCAK